MWEPLPQRLHALEGRNKKPSRPIPRPTDCVPPPQALLFRIMATILTHAVLAKQPGRYIGWPTIARTPDDKLLVVFSGDRDGHVCPFGKTFMIRSSDNGESWSAPELINNTPLDDRDTGILACRDGSVLVSWFTYYRTQWGEEDSPASWREQMATVSQEDVERWSRPDLIEAHCGRRGHWLRRSPDGGQTWDEPIAVPPTAPHGPLQLSDGSLLFVGNEAYLRDDRSSRAVAAASRDGGRTWEVVGGISMFPASRHQAPDRIAYLGEPHAVEAEPGRIVGMARYEEHGRPTEKEVSVLWQFESNDGGCTWTEPRPTSIIGKPPHLTKLKDGRLLVTYGHRFSPFGQRACLSADGGRSWHYAHEIVLRDDAANGDLGYPASVECADGTIMTVYYQIDQPGEKTCLMATRWRP